MSGAAVKLPSSLEEFLPWEERQPEKWEFLGGRPRAMTGGSRGHDRIANNLRGLLFLALRGQPCSVHGPDLRVVSPSGAAMYPDALIRCGPSDDHAMNCDDPVVVVEVLSPATAKDDLTRKRRAYKAIPGLRVIVYVSQDEPRLDLVRRREDGGWDEDEAVEGLDAVLELPEIDLRLPMAEIYEDTLVARAAG
jgi:Uma2 family endonuclease